MPLLSGLRVAGFLSAVVLKLRPALCKIGPNTKMNEIVQTHLPGIELVGSRRFAGEAGSIRAVQVTVAAPADDGPSGARPITFQVRAADDPTTRVTEKSTFVLP